VTTIEFLPSKITLDVPAGTRLLAAARQANVPIRYGCGAAQCGQCAVAVAGHLSEAAPRESKLLKRLELPLDGTVRLACQASVEDGKVTVDLEFQDRWDPSMAPAVF
jgi:ferredoxin